MASTIPLITAIEQAQLRSLPDFRVGDTVKVHFRISEGEKDRVQIFQGTVIRKCSGGVGATFAVRKTSYGVGVERIFPLHTSRIEKIEIVTKGHVRRARLNYLRQLQGKAARIKSEKRDVEETVAAPAAAPAAATPTA